MFLMNLMIKKMIKKVVLIMKMNQKISSLKYLLKEKKSWKYAIKKSDTDELILSYTKDLKNIWYRFIFRQW